MHKQNFAGINVEVGANWVEGVNGGKMNPIWPIVNSTLKLRNFRSDFDYLAQNVYKEEYVVVSETESTKKYACGKIAPIRIQALSSLQLQETWRTLHSILHASSGEEVQNIHTYSLCFKLYIFFERTARALPKFY